jgi:hypothetical protein
MRWTLFLLTALLAAGCGKRGIGPGQTSDSPNSSTAGRPWTPDAKLLDQLDPPTEVAGYLVRPPKGYKRIDAQHKPITLSTWEAPHKDGGDRVFLLVSVWQITEDQKAKAQPEKVLNDAFDASAKLCDPFSRSSVEPGTLGGLIFLRASGSGPFRFQKERVLKDFYYVALDGDRLIQLTATAEVLSGRTDLLDLPEAGLLTFQKK